MNLFKKDTPGKQAGKINVSCVLSFIVSASTIDYLLFFKKDYNPDYK